MRLFPTPRYQNVQELLDRSEDVTPHDLVTTLRDIRRANIFGLGTWVVKHHLARLLEGCAVNQPIRILDIATGSSDIPEEICRWGMSKGLEISFVATDISESILRVARQRINKAGLGDMIDFAVCDATRPPFMDGEFDFVTCSLALHHLDVTHARLALREMARISRCGFIVNDIYRSQGAWYMARFLSHISTGNRLTRHDGPASVLRAYTPAELRRLGESAGVGVRVYTHPFWRMAAVGARDDGFARR